MKIIAVLLVLFSQVLSIESQAQSSNDIAFELKCVFYGGGPSKFLELGFYNQEIENQLEADDAFQLTECGLNQSQLDSEEAMILKNSSWKLGSVEKKEKLLITLEKKCTLELPTFEEIDQVKGQGSIKSISAVLKGTKTLVGSCLYIPLQLGVISGGNH